MRHPLRIQRKRTAGWRKPEGAVCVTRPGVFGNPFETAAAFGLWLAGGGVTVNDLKSFLPFNDESLHCLALKRAEILKRLPELRGKHVVCFCSPEQDCHADVLARLANTNDELTGDGNGSS